MEEIRGGNPVEAGGCGVGGGVVLKRCRELRSLLVAAAGVDVVLRVAAPGEYVSPVGATALLESLP